MNLNLGKVKNNMSHKGMPELVYRFYNLLWAHMHKDWLIKHAYQKGVLFFSVIIDENATKKIRRPYYFKDIKKRGNDLWGLAEDCAEEIMQEAQRIYDNSTD